MVLAKPRATTRQASSQAQPKRSDTSAATVPRGRDVIFQYLADAGVTRLFGVPGTNEIPIIDGTKDSRYHIEYVPCLHENIAMGAAMGYARASGKPGVVELHVTPGVGHGLGNLFNAAKSRVPMIVLCGQQHSELLLQEPLLASDLVRVARQYTKWAYEVRSVNELPMAMQRAVKTALTPPTGPVLLSIPWEFTVQQVGYQTTPKVTKIATGAAGDAAAIKQAAEILAAARHPVIVAGDGVGAANAWKQLGALAEQIGAPVYCEQLGSYLNFPNSDHHWQGELPNTQKDMQAVLDPHDTAFLCGFNGQAQLVVFKWSDGPLIPTTLTQVYLHDDPWEIGKNYYGDCAILGDIAATLPLITKQVPKAAKYDAAAVAERNKNLHAYGASRDTHLREYAEVVLSGARDQGSDVIPADQVAMELRSLQDNKVITKPITLVNEAISDTTAFQAYLEFDSPNSYLAAEGGSLGYSMPASIGVKLAVGDSRMVINAVGDGSTLFYPHTWWTTYGQQLPILYLITNNLEYKTLIVGLDAIKTAYRWTPTAAADYLQLDANPVDFVALATAFRIDAARVSRPAELTAALTTAVHVVQQKRKPYVLEIMTDRSIKPVSAGHNGSPKSRARAAELTFPRLDTYFANMGGIREYDTFGPA